VNEEAKLNAAVELAKVAYEDAFQPPAKQAGRALGTVGEVVNLALEPLRGVVWGYDKIKTFVNERATEKLKEKGVKEEHIITPDPDIAVPSIEALRYSKLKDEFATLLASSMDKNNLGEVHPSFVEILKQISGDEAKILKYLSGLPSPIPFVELTYHKGGKRSFAPLGDFYGSLAIESNCTFPKSTNSYMTNLLRLGLLEKIGTIRLAEENKYTRIIATHPKAKEILDKENKEYRVDKRVFRISPLGNKFLKYCLQ